MPKETPEAINWALGQTVTLYEGEPWEETIRVTMETKSLLVEQVRKYFNENEIEYDTYDYYDLKPYL